MSFPSLYPESCLINQANSPHTSESPAVCQAERQNPSLTKTKDVIQPVLGLSEEILFWMKLIWLL